ncbi:MAG: hypothetical protein A2583_07705 [Bdellovibrionales bacterium RIFOXYD1_FULL_53_11]|nr:MAG: hypothetical protein A2583_07705 [Bdellovibrionales bacterium RIFOXYD1_FULL_53_11]
MPRIIENTVTGTFLKRVQETPDLVGFQHKTGKNWAQVTFKQFHDQCKLVSLGLSELGVKPGETAAIMSNTCFEWALCDMAILGASAITVPIYASNSAGEAAFILNHSEARVVFVEDEKQLEKIIEKRGTLPKLLKVVVMKTASAGSISYQGTNDFFITIDILKSIGLARSEKDPDGFRQRLISARKDDVLTICYTSGTTGVPKGAMVTHDNMMSVLEDAGAALGPSLVIDGEIMLTFLPFSHILGKVEEMGTYAYGWRECYAQNLGSIMMDIAEVRPTMLFAVPRIFEKAYTRINALANSGPPLKRKLFAWAVKTGKSHLFPVRPGIIQKLFSGVLYALARNIVLDKIKNKFGGNVKYAICGGAPFAREIGEFFRVAGILVLEGYGLTETCAPVSFNGPDSVRFGSVGKPLADVRIRIAEDGEICIKSRKVFKGYFKMPAETADVLVDGWLQTGDIGHLSKDGYLHITDRKKDIIITSGGKNIAPQKIENLAKPFTLINHLVVHGDKRHFLTALVTLDKEETLKFAKLNQIAFNEYQELANSVKLRESIQKAVDQINAQLATFESIKKFTILPNEFSVETGELTPSLKIKRNVVTKKFQTELDGLYNT